MLIVQSNQTVQVLNLEQSQPIIFSIPELAIQLAGLVCLGLIRGRDEKSEICIFAFSKIFQTPENYLIRRNRWMISLFGVVNELVVGKCISVSSQPGVEHTIRPGGIAAPSFVFETQYPKNRTSRLLKSVSILVSDLE